MKRSREWAVSRTSAELRARQTVVDLASQDLVFPSETRGPLTGWNLVMRHFRPIVLNAKVPTIRFHDLRHTFATLMLRNGVPVKDVAYMLGHSDAATTIRVYAHAIPSTHGAHAQMMGALLTGPAGCGLLVEGGETGAQP